MRVTSRGTSPPGGESMVQTPLPRTGNGHSSQRVLASGDQCHYILVQKRGQIEVRDREIGGPNAVMTGEPVVEMTRRSGCLMTARRQNKNPEACRSGF